MILLHGFMDCGATWQFLVDSLPASWSCVAPDWRGFGTSAWAPQGYWFPDYLADLDALLGVLVPRGRARIVAHSMGANIAAMYAGIRPDRIAWLASLDGIGLPRSAPGEAPDRYGRWLSQLLDPPKGTRYRSLAHLTEMLMSRNPRLPRDRAEFIARAWSTGAADEPDLRLVFDPRHRLVNPVLYRREEAQACWARIAAPLLVLLAGRSEFLAHMGADGSPASVQEQFPGATIVSLPEVGHSMHHEDPAAVARYLAGFEVAHRDRSLPG